MFTSVDTAAAVSCSPVPYGLSAGGIGVWDDGQAGPCMGRCMDGAWVGAWVCGCCIGCTTWDLFVYRITAIYIIDIVSKHSRANFVCTSHN